MSARTFTVTLEIEARLELDEAVLAQVTDEWRSRFYRLDTPEEIAQHVGRKLEISCAGRATLAERAR